jgi:hypothetical protein
MVQAFFTALAIALIGCAVQPMIVGTYRRIPTIATFVAAAVCLLMALVWNWLPTPEPGSLRAGIESAANDFRWWFAVIAAIWTYQVTINILTEIRRNNEILALRNDVQSIVTVLERSILPRHLNRGQQSAIINFLSRFPPCEVAFKVISRDDEASGYCGDLQQALTKAGWKITKTNYSDDIQAGGIRTNFIQTMEHSQQPDDPAKPKPDHLIQIAIGLAGVRWEGGGRGGGVNVTEDLLTIEIGRRRKDSYTIDPPIGFPY